MFCCGESKSKRRFGTKEVETRRKERAIYIQNKGRVVDGLRTSVTEVGRGSSPSAVNFFLMRWEIGLDIHLQGLAWQ